MFGPNARRRLGSLQMNLRVYSERGCCACPACLSRLRGIRSNMAAIAETNRGFIRNSPRAAILPLSLWAKSDVIQTWMIGLHVFFGCADAQRSRLKLVRCTPIVCLRWRPPCGQAVDRG